jgi:hypothetical protein
LHGVKIDYNTFMVRNLREKVKQWFLPREDEIILVFTIILVALIGFGLGRLSALREEKFPIQIQTSLPSAFESENQEAGLPVSRISDRGGEGKQEKLYVGSRNGSVYHYPWCPGAERIKEANKVWFSSREEAGKAGYRPAANCEGL